MLGVLNKRFSSLLIAAVLAFGFVSVSSSQMQVFAKTVRFAGYDWDVKEATLRGPGPNNWNPDNVWVDTAGRLHLKLTIRNGRCKCAEVSTRQRFGFGRYQFQLGNVPNNLDPQIVFGLFSYPTPDVGPDATKEIDIEFARWGRSWLPLLNYTIWPNIPSLKEQHQAYPMTLSNKTGYLTTHRYTWKSNSIYFQSLYGHRNDNTNQFASWLYQPSEPLNRISQAPMPLHINLWCFQGKLPKNGKPVEMIISSFSYQPL